MTIGIRPANRADLPRLTEIYNHYVIHTPVTFDVEPYTVETTVYSSHENVGKGIGRKLYAGLFEALAGENIHRIVGGYTLPNDGSAKLHEVFGFKSVGIFTEVGYKFGKYWDVAWTERPLRLP